MLHENGKAAGMKDDYLYLRIYEELKGEIARGVYQTGDLFPPERALKERFSTTHITVRNALTRLVEEGYIERFSGKGTYVTYRNSDEEDGEHEIRLRTIRLIMERIDSFTAGIVNHLSEHIEHQDIDIVTDIRRKPSFRQDGKETFQVWLFPESSGEYIPREGLHDNTLVVASRDIDSSSPRIICDISSGISAAVKYAKEAGHTSLAYVGTHLDITGGVKRDAFLDALGKHDLPGGGNALMFSGGTIEAGVHACVAMLRKKPDATGFLCADDFTAAGVRECLVSRGRDEGPDPLVIGFGNTEISSFFRFPSLDLKAHQLAALIYQNVLEYTGTGRVLRSAAVVQPDLVIRRRSDD